MKTNDFILDEQDKGQNKGKLFWGWLFYINIGFLAITILGFAGIWLGLVLMIPLGVINLVSAGIMLVKRIREHMEVKCIIAYYLAAFATLFLGYLITRDQIHLDYNVIEYIILAGGVFCFVLSAFVSYMLNKHRKEV
ncbi:MAG: hypothetical protein ACPGWM_07115 [Flavobacteriales bacterium]